MPRDSKLYLRDILHATERIPGARWREVARFRDRMVHHYFSLDLAIIWEIVTIHLPELKTSVETLLNKLEHDNSGQIES